MSLKDEIERGVFNCDASVHADQQERDPVLVGVWVEGKATGGICAVKSVGAEIAGTDDQEGVGAKFVITIPLVEDLKSKIPGVAEVQLSRDLPAFDDSMLGKVLDFKLDYKEYVEDPKNPKAVVINSTPLDAYDMVVEIMKIERHVVKGHGFRKITLMVIGHRSELDIEPPTVSMPNAPFAETQS